MSLTEWYKEVEKYMADKQKEAEEQGHRLAFIVLPIESVDDSNGVSVGVFSPFEYEENITLLTAAIELLDRNKYPTMTETKGNA